MKKYVVLLVAGAVILAQPTTAQVFTEPKPKPQVQPRPARPKPQPRVTSPGSIPRQPSLLQTPRITNFSDPVPYCSAVRTADVPGPTYTGQPVPNWVSSATSGAQPAAGSSLAYNWRCMNGRVLSCASTPELSSCSKPDQSRDVTPELTAYCKGKRKGEVPQSIVGNTVPIWACRSGQPEISGYRSGLDPQGYFTQQWQDVTDYSPANMIGGIPRMFIGKWRVRTKTTGLLSFVYDIRISLATPRGGVLAGQADYFQINSFNGQATHLCSTRLMRSGTNLRVMELDEQFTVRTPNIACPVQGRLAAQQKDGQLLLEWRRLKDGKVTLSGWGEPM